MSKAITAGRLLPAAVSSLVHRARICLMDDHCWTAGRYVTKLRQETSRNTCWKLNYEGGKHGKRLPYCDLGF